MRLDFRHEALLIEPHPPEKSSCVDGVRKMPFFGFVLLKSALFCHVTFWPATLTPEGEGKIIVRCLGGYLADSKLSAVVTPRYF